MRAQCRGCGVWWDDVKVGDTCRGCGIEFLPEDVPAPPVKKKAVKKARKGKS